VLYEDGDRQWHRLYTEGAPPHSLAQPRVGARVCAPRSVVRCRGCGRCARRMLRLSIRAERAVDA
jgi:hypothetical protein